MLKQTRAFTLVELIVVITILAILWTIGFISLQWFSRDARDSLRVTDFKSIEKWLEILLTKWESLPEPEDYVEIKANWTTISYQWYAWEKVLWKVKVFWWWKDPLDDTYYTYLTDTWFRNYQLLWFLENWDQISLNKNLLNKTHAIDYSNRYPILKWKPLWVIVDSITKQPIQVTWTGIDLVTETNEYKVYLSKNEAVTWTWWSLKSLQLNASCKRIKEINLNSKNWVYSINPTWISEFEVYCDMAIDGGGWTYVTMLADTTTRNYFKTANTDKITSLSENISTKWQISNLWLDDNNRDIFIQCFTNHPNFKTYEIPLIIYNYKKLDINNLEKQDKAWTIFSTENLKAKWNWNKFYLNNIYRTSSSNETMYLENMDGKWVFISVSSATLSIRNTSYPKSWAYTTITEPEEAINVWFINGNYCVTAIR